MFACWEADFPDVDVRVNDDERVRHSTGRSTLARFGVGESEERAISKRVRPFASVREEPFVSLAPVRRIISCEVARPGARNKFNLLDEEEDGDVLRGNFRCAGGGVRGNGV